MLASILGRPVQAYGQRSPAALGAALLTTLADAREGTAPTIGAGRATPTMAPGPDAARYDDLYRQYTSLFPRAALPPGTA
jgi:sugar (pentulose or hexulose) kinase